MRINFKKNTNEVVNKGASNFSGFKHFRDLRTTLGLIPNLLKKRRSFMSNTEKRRIRESEVAAKIRKAKSAYRDKN
jgi:hypothetical protein